MPVKSDRKRKKIFVVEDHAIVREGLSMLLNAQSDLSVCGVASSAEEARQAIVSSRPDLAIMDLSLEGSSGLDLVKDLKDRCPEVPVLVLSMHDETLYAERVLRAGARGYLMKREAGRELLVAVRRILEGKIYLSEGLSEVLLESVAQGRAAKGESPLSRLGDRELEVFELIGRGTKTSEIAKKLHISVKTVETHRARIKEKLGLADSAKLVEHAVRWAQRG
jgi:DNA-binding NarL/FixJ family response regulator